MSVQFKCSVLFHWRFFSVVRFIYVLLQPSSWCFSWFWSLQVQVGGAITILHSSFGLVYLTSPCTLCYWAVYFLCAPSFSNHKVNSSTMLLLLVYEILKLTTTMKKLKSVWCLELFLKENKIRYSLSLFLLIIKVFLKRKDTANLHSLESTLERKGGFISYAILIEM